MKKAFAMEVGVSSWEEAVESYPLCATENEMSRYIQLSSKPVLTAFQQFCRKTVLSADSAQETQSPPDHEQIECEVDSIVYHTINLALTPDKVTYQEVAALVVNSFTGFETIIIEFSLLSKEQVSVVLW